MITKLSRISCCFRLYCNLSEKFTLHEARAPINALSTNIKSLLEDQVFYDRDYGRYYCANKGCTTGYKKVVTYYDYAEAIYNISVDLNFPLIFRHIKTPCFHNEGF